MRTPLAALAALFLIAHLLNLPPTLEDIDSVNFALGVREFDVTRHQPHPPGYPVFVALGKLAMPALEALDPGSAAARALALWSVMAGAAAVPLLFLLFRSLWADPRLAWWATAAAACSPLFWFSALRPLSDMTGLACVLAAHVLLVPLLVPAAVPHRRPAHAGQPRGPATKSQGAAVEVERYVTASRSSGARLVAGAAICGVAAGVRSQTVVLIAPLLLVAMVWPGTGASLRHRGAAVLALVVGALAWGVPLLVLSGGLSGFLAALGTQAGEDFAGVVMLWTAREARVAAEALLNTFIWPWGSLARGLAVAALAAAGAALAAWRAPRALAVLAVGFAPYTVFHLLFQETVTMRYALPLVPPVTFLALFAAAAAGRLAIVLAGTALVVTSLTVTLPAARAYARDGSPAFRLFQRVVVADGPAVLGFHGVMRRVAEWERPAGPEVLDAPFGREWLQLVAHWRERPGSRVHFVADPRRTDLALFDPQTRRLRASARWTFPEVPFVAGTRPGAADLYVMDPPGWMLGEGWALTAEIGGVTARAGLGPASEAAVAWVRARPEDATLIIGGRNLGSGSAPAHLSVAGEAGVIDSWEAGSGFFFRRVPIPAGTLAGSGYLALRVTATAVDETAPPPVALEQFDLQSAGAPMVGLLSGWHEPEYSPARGQAWRWMSERARLWVGPAGRDLTLTISGESPLRYFDRAPVVRVTAAGTELARFEPSSDFTREVILPAAALAASGGVVLMESDLWFTPAERAGAADQRQLALRVYRLAVR